ncbi:MAG: AI-2E family transporter [Kiritimatiellae bacterium]|nr:AI-2E family transporter [Kiritimatiellia bacterium]
MTSIVLGIFLAMFFRPYYTRWLKTVKNPTLAATLMLLSVLVPLGLLAWYGGAKLSAELASLGDLGPKIAAKYQEWMGEFLPGVNIADYYDEIRKQAMGVGKGVMSVMEGALTWILALVFAGYFVTRPDMRGEDCVREMPFLKDDTKSFVAEQINAFLDIMISFFQRQTKICLLEGCMYGAGFWLVGLPYGFIIGFALGVLNLCPFLGTVACMPIALPLAYFFGGSWVRMLLVLGVWAAGLILDGYVITPKIQGNKTGLGYMGVIFSFLFWGSVFHSLLGLLLAIPLSAFCVVLWRALKAKYLRPVV